MMLETGDGRQAKLLGSISEWQIAEETSAVLEL